MAGDGAIANFPKPINPWEKKKGEKDPFFAPGEEGKGQALEPMIGRRKKRGGNEEKAYLKSPAYFQLEKRERIFAFGGGGKNSFQTPAKGKKRTHQRLFGSRESASKGEREKTAIRLLLRLRSG